MTPRTSTPSRDGTPRRTALVTGAGRGIGRAIALELGRTGFNVVVNYRSDQASAARTVADVEAAGGAAEAVVGDVALDADRRRLVQRALEGFGGLDLLVNNAGVAPAKREDLLDVGEEDFARVLQINLAAPFFLSQLVAAHWLREGAGPTDPPPMIIQIGSLSAEAVSANRAQYCVAKAGLAMVTQLFAARLAAHGVLVYEVRPGIIATDMSAPVKEQYDKMIYEEGRIPIARWGRPEDVARVVGMLVAGTLGYSTGNVIEVDGGFHIRRL